MLPPLNLSGSKSNGFFARKRRDARDNSTASPLVRRQTVAAVHGAAESSSAAPCETRQATTTASLAAQSARDSSNRAAVCSTNTNTSTARALSSPRAAVFDAIATASTTTTAALPNNSNSSSNSDATDALASISMIPREFFVLETHAVLPAAQYPTTQYHSRFVARTGLWETVVFPALAPQTRQQVLLLRETLARMRHALDTSGISNRSSRPSDSRSRLLALAYTRDECRVYSLCFHELVRQVACICKEQSALLGEIRVHYDAALAQLFTHAQELHSVADRQQQHIGDLELQHETAQRATDALVEQTLRSQQQQQQQQQQLATVRSRPRRQRRRRCSCDRHSNSSNSGSDSDYDDSDDDEERAWRRERRDGAQLERASAAEAAHVAAARLQTAYHTYHVRTEQQRLAQHAKQHVAALEIQRSFRGFRQRQLVRHRRAVMRVILQRRQEAAAINLLQANVRSYLLKQKRSADSARRRQSKRMLQPSRDGDAARADATGQDASGSSRSDELARTSSAALDGVAGRRERELLVAHLRAADGPNAALASVLEQFSTLAVAVAALQSFVSSSIPERLARDASDVAAKCEPADADSTAVSKPLDDTIAHVAVVAAQFHATVAALVPHHGADATGPDVSASTARDKSSSNSSSDSKALLDERSTDDDATTLCQSTSTSSLDLRLLPFDVVADAADQDVSNSLSDRRSSLALSVATTCYGRQSSSTVPLGTLEHRRDSDSSSDDVDLDDSFWRAETSAIHLDERRAQQTHSSLRLRALLASTHDATKDLVWLKQLMSDAYDTVVGRLRAVPPTVLQQFITTRCALAMSLNESQRFGALHNQREPALASVLTCRLADVIREHFTCQSGLRHLVQRAEAHLDACVARFRDVDADVERFHAFLRGERSHDELLFYCVCRHLASSGDSMSPNSKHQPVFDPDTMRELIDRLHALHVARTLFRVDASDALCAADADVVETDNAVYKRFQSPAAFGQFEAVLSAYYVDDDNVADDVAGSAEAIALPPHSRPPGSIVRPSNIHQFHSTQFPVVAARSPLVRQRHHKTTTQQQHAARPSRLATSTSTTSEWLHFDDVVDLLLRYRREMLQFHRFTRWTHELFASASVVTTVSTIPPSPPPLSLLSEAQFVDVLAPHSLGPNERELANVYNNALRQRRLTLLRMPLRVFTSVVLLLLRNGQLSVSTYRSQGARDSVGGRGDSDEKRWLQLARQWRSREAAFERALEAIYEVPAGDDGAESDDAATRLLELRNELFTLFIGSNGAANLTRAEELLALLNARLEVHAPTTSRSIDVARTYLPDDGDDDVDSRNLGGGDRSRDDQRSLQKSRNAPEHQRSMRPQSPEDHNDASAWETDSTTT